MTGVFALVHLDVPDRDLLVKSLKCPHKEVGTFNNDNDFDILFAKVGNKYSEIGLIFNNTDNRIPFFKLDGTGPSLRGFIERCSINDVNIVNIISCNFTSLDIIVEFELLEKEFGVKIRYSLDKTGSTENWIMESDGTDIKSLFFNSEIDNYKHTLGPIGSHMGFIEKKGDFLTLRMVGKNNYGQLGVGDTTSRNISVPTITGVVGVACGGSHTVAVKSNGEVWSSGKNTDGQLGLGTTTDTTTFTKVDINGIVQASCGLDHSILIDSFGNVYAMGSNSVGQLGLGDNVSRALVPIKVSDISDIVQVACGRNFTLALDSKGIVYGTGDNTNGNLGLGISGGPDFNNRKRFTKSTFTEENFIKQVACGDYHSLLLGNRGDVWSCGLNTNGQLGISGIVLGSEPNLITDLSSVRIQQVACGENHSVFLDVFSEMHSVGDNRFNQLGFLTTGTSTSTVGKITDISGVYGIACGKNSTYGLQFTTEVKACGLNSDGQLGDGSTTDSSTFINVLINSVPSMDSIITTIADSYGFLEITIEEKGYYDKGFITVDPDNLVYSDDQSFNFIIGDSKLSTNVLQTFILDDLLPGLKNYISNRLINNFGITSDILSDFIFSVPEKNSDNVLRVKIDRILTGEKFLYVPIIIPYQQVIIYDNTGTNLLKIFYDETMRIEYYINGTIYSPDENTEFVTDFYTFKIFKANNTGIIFKIRNLDNNLGSYITRLLEFETENVQFGELENYGASESFIEYSKSRLNNVFGISGNIVDDLILAKVTLLNDFTSTSMQNVYKQYNTFDTIRDLLKNYSPDTESIDIINDPLNLSFFENIRDEYNLYSSESLLNFFNNYRRNIALNPNNERPRIYDIVSNPFYRQEFMIDLGFIENNEKLMYVPLKKNVVDVYVDTIQKISLDNNGNKIYIDISNEITENVPVYYSVRTFIPEEQTNNNEDFVDGGEGGEGGEGMPTYKQEEICKISLIGGTYILTGKYIENNVSMVIEPDKTNNIDITFKTLSTSIDIAKYQEIKLKIIPYQTDGFLFKFKEGEIIELSIFDNLSLPELLTSPDTLLPQISDKINKRYIHNSYISNITQVNQIYIDALKYIFTNLQLNSALNNILEKSMRILVPFKCSLALKNLETHAYFMNSIGIPIIDSIISSSHQAVDFIMSEEIDIDDNIATALNLYSREEQIFLNSDNIPLIGSFNINSLFNNSHYMPFLIEKNNIQYNAIDIDEIPINNMIINCIPNINEENPDYFLVCYRTLSKYLGTSAYMTIPGILRRLVNNGGSVSEYTFAKTFRDSDFDPIRTIGEADRESLFINYSTNYLSKDLKIPHFVIRFRYIDGKIEVNVFKYFFRAIYDSRNITVSRLDGTSRMYKLSTLYLQKTTYMLDKEELKMNLIFDNYIGNENKLPLLSQFRDILYLKTDITNQSLELNIRYNYKHLFCNFSNSVDNRVSDILTNISKEIKPFYTSEEIFDYIDKNDPTIDGRMSRELKEFLLRDTIEDIYFNAYNSVYNNLTVERNNLNENKYPITLIKGFSNFSDNYFISDKNIIHTFLRNISRLKNDLRNPIHDLINPNTIILDDLFNDLRYYISLHLKIRDKILELRNDRLYLTSFDRYLEKFNPKLADDIMDFIRKNFMDFSPSSSNNNEFDGFMESYNRQENNLDFYIALTVSRFFNFIYDNDLFSMPKKTFKIYTDLLLLNYTEVVNEKNPYTKLRKMVINSQNYQEYIDYLNNITNPHGTTYYDDRVYSIEILDKMIDNIFYREMTNSLNITSLPYIGESVKEESKNNKLFGLHETDRFTVLKNYLGLIFIAIRVSDKLIMDRKELIVKFIAKYILKTEFESIPVDDYDEIIDKNYNLVDKYKADEVRSLVLQPIANETYDLAKLSVNPVQFFMTGIVRPIVLSDNWGDSQFHNYSLGELIGEKTAELTYKSLSPIMYVLGGVLSIPKAFLSNDYPSLSANPLFMSPYTFSQFILSISNLKLLYNSVIKDLDKLRLIVLANSARKFELSESQYENIENQYLNLYRRALPYYQEYIKMKTTPVSEDIKDYDEYTEIYELYIKLKDVVKNLSMDPSTYTSFSYNLATRDDEINSYCGNIMVNNIELIQKLSVFELGVGEKTLPIPFDVFPENWIINPIVTEITRPYDVSRTYYSPIKICFPNHERALNLFTTKYLESLSLFNLYNIKSITKNYRFVNGEGGELNKFSKSTLPSFCIEIPNIDTFKLFQTEVDLSNSSAAYCIKHTNNTKLENLTYKSISKTITIFEIDKNSPTHKLNSGFSNYDTYSNAVLPSFTLYSHPIYLFNKNIKFVTELYTITIEYDDKTDMFYFKYIPKTIRELIKKLRSSSNIIDFYELNELIPNLNRNEISTLISASLNLSETDILPIELYYMLPEETNIFLSTDNLNNIGFKNLWSTGVLYIPFDDNRDTFTFNVYSSLFIFRNINGELSVYNPILRKTTFFGKTYTIYLENTEFIVEKNINGLLIRCNGSPTIINFNRELVSYFVDNNLKLPRFTRSIYKLDELNIDDKIKTQIYLEFKSNVKNFGDYNQLYIVNILSVIDRNGKNQDFYFDLGKLIRNINVWVFFPQFITKYDNTRNEYIIDLDYTNNYEQRIKININNSPLTIINGSFKSDINNSVSLSVIKSALTLGVLSSDIDSRRRNASSDTMTFSIGGDNIVISLAQHKASVSAIADIYMDNGLLMSINDIFVSDVIFTNILENESITDGYYTIPELNDILPNDYTKRIFLSNLKKYFELTDEEMTFLGFGVCDLSENNVYKVNLYNETTPITSIIKDKTLLFIPYKESHTIYMNISHSISFIFYQSSSGLVTKVKVIQKSLKTNIETTIYNNDLNEGDNLNLFNISFNVYKYNKHGILFKIIHSLRREEIDENTTQTLLLTDFDLPDSKPDENTIILDVFKNVMSMRSLENFNSIDNESQVTRVTNSNLRTFGENNETIKNILTSLHGNNINILSSSFDDTNEYYTIGDNLSSISPNDALYMPVPINQTTGESNDFYIKYREFTAKIKVDKVNETIYVNDVAYYKGSSFMIGDKTFMVNGIGGMSMTLSTTNIIPCFVKGTKILTPKGNVNIEDLETGDLILTHDKRELSVIVRKRVIHKTTEADAPYKIPKNFFGKNIPNRDTYISPYHAILLKKNIWMFPALLSEKFKSVTRENLGEMVEYYHLETPDYLNDTLIANNLIAETFAGDKFKNKIKYIFNEKHMGFVRLLKTNDESTEILSYKSQLRNVQMINTRKNYRN